MQVKTTTGAVAQCVGRGEERQVNLLLVGEQPVGTWILVSQDIAREVLDADDAARRNLALDALELAMRGEIPDDRFFADLIERGPQLPEWLRKENSS
jgi:hydrogenase expression/formation protein HypC